MKKLLLGWLAVGSFAVFGGVAFAETSSDPCSAGDLVAKEFAPNYAAGVAAVEKELVAKGMDPVEAKKVATQQVNDTLNAVAAQPTAAMSATQQAGDIIVNAIDTGANVTAFGGVNSANAKLNTIEGMAAVAASGYNCGWELWVNPFAVWAEDDGKVVATAIGKGITRGSYEADVYGVNLGVTKRFNNWYLGAMFGYANTDVDFTHGAWGGFDSDTITLALLGGFEINNFFVNLGVGYSWIDYDDMKLNATAIDSKDGTVAPRTDARAAASDHDGDMWFTNIELGYNFKLANCWTITPTIGWKYSHLETDAYNLTGIGLTANEVLQAPRYADSKHYSSRMPIKIKVARDFGAASVFVQGGYIREFNDNAPGVAYGTAGSVGYVGYARGVRAAQNYGTVGAGVKATIGRWNLGLAYDYLWNTDEFDSHTLNGYVGITF